MIPVKSGTTAEDPPNDECMDSHFFFQPSLTRYSRDINRPPRGPPRHETKHVSRRLNNVGSNLALLPCIIDGKIPHEGNLQGKHGVPNYWPARPGSRSGGMERKRYGLWERQTGEGKRVEGLHSGQHPQ